MVLPAGALSPLGWRLVAGCLAATVGLAAFGAWLWSREGETPVFELLLFSWQWPEAAVEQIDSAAAWLNLAAGVALLLAAAGLLSYEGRALKRFPRGLGMLSVTAAAWCAAWQVALAGAAWARDENFRPGVSWGPLEDWLGNVQILGEVAVRVAAPCVLIAWLPGRAEFPAARANRLVWLLRLAAALTFAVHGYEALRHNSRFVDLLLAADHRFLSGELSEASAKWLLLPIGWIDLLLAALILAVRWRWVAAYMAIWGLLTALSRLVHSGWEGGWETLLRAPNCGVPLAVYLYWWSATRRDIAAMAHDQPPPPRS